MRQGNEFYVAGDPYTNSGFWGPPTSAVNFCEEDYVVTRYVAEFINTLTNLAYVYLAIRDARTPRRGYSSGGKQTGGGSQPPGLDLMSGALAAVGVTSFIFHATLKHSTQFADEVSMLVLAGALLQGVYCAGSSNGRRNGLITASVVATVVAMSAYYLQSGNFVVHLVMFSLLIHNVWPRTIYLIYNRTKAGPERSKLFRKFYTAVAWCLAAFALWNVDIEWCQAVRKLQAATGLPWSWLLELHGWWHVMTGLGAAAYIDLIRDLSV
ncbi:alkaline ceramidase family protein [Podospora didyma]|uniref:Alkaline ceramidase family protein n=1 Tax=Podospora didyma TaxID=330526 RepID=A0AAE0NTK3_9PEZI|nr:alkaline ceramidase family protein [Podospora didyma]